MIKAVDLLVSQLEALSSITSELLAYARKTSPDGWDREEMEIVDAVLNGVIQQAQCCLGGIGEPLRRLRNGG